MGIFISKLRDLFSTAPPSRILLLGLDAAGKTTILYKMKLDETVTTIPTIGFNVETITPAKGMNFIVWDIGGQERIRALWRHYYNGTQGLIFVIDSSDRQRMEEAKSELFNILDEGSMMDVPVEIIANKQDLIGAMKPFEIADVLGLHKQRHRMWHVQGACAILGDGLYEAMESLVSMIKKQNSNKSWYQMSS